jgi:hypothetical protein
MYAHICLRFHGKCRERVRVRVPWLRRAAPWSHWIFLPPFTAISSAAEGSVRLRGRSLVNSDEQIVPVMNEKKRRMFDTVGVQGDEDLNVRAGCRLL